MNIKITKDTLDGSNWTSVHFSTPYTYANPDCLDHDKITSLRSLRHKHKLAGGSERQENGNANQSGGKSYLGYNYKTVHIENPTIDFEKDLMLWRMS